MQRRGSSSGTSRFNGATAFRQWKQHGAEIEILRLPELQWGHRLSAVETASYWSYASSYSWLQWGHRLSAVETPVVVVLLDLDNAASMGPPPFGSGNKHDVVSGADALRVASMGPPPFGSGNLVSGLSRRLASGWRFNGAHRLSAVEPRSAQRPRGCSNASMGPPPFGSGNRQQENVNLRAPRFNGATAFRQWKPNAYRGWQGMGWPASMGPPPFGSGNFYNLFSRMLQGPASMGPPPFGSGNLPHVQVRYWKGRFLCPLQWGHRLSAVETRYQTGINALGDLRLASMGPPPFGSGNFEKRQVGILVRAVACFNGATAFRQVETA